jgi:hypothetical protein
VYQCSLLKVKAWVSRAPSPGYMQEPTLFSTEQASATPPLERARSISLAQVSLTMLLSASPEYSKVKHLRTYRKEEKEITNVAPDIAAALKIISRLWKKNRFLASCSFMKKGLV